VPTREHKKDANKSMPGAETGEISDGQDRFDGLKTSIGNRREKRAES